MNVNNFTSELRVFIKGEKYSVRDNGAVLRHAKNKLKPRPNDAFWTFGRVNHRNGYMHLGDMRVHRIVCEAFHGEPPTAQHIVDHIDTNRQNNRPENLRWITKLENILNNPITRRRIIIQCGSIEAFLANPSMLKESRTEPNFKWMRTVTKEEAASCLRNLTEWANKDIPPKGKTLGEWVFETVQNQNRTDFRTEGAIQKNWNTPTEFPLCPSADEQNPIKTYAASLSIGKAFAINRNGNSLVKKFALSKDQSILYVMTKSEEWAIKPYGLAVITFEDGKYVHDGRGTFFQEDGAEKYYMIAQGLEWTKGEVFDDF